MTFHTLAIWFVLLPVTLFAGDFRVTMEKAYRLHISGQLVQAEALAREAVAQARDSSPLDRAEALQFLAGVLLERGNFNEAEEHRRSVLDLTQKNGGSESLVIRALSYLGETLILQGKSNEAKLFIDRALEHCARVNGPDHPANATPLFLLARWYRSRAEPDRALPLARRALWLAQKDPAFDPRQIAEIQGELGMIHFSQNKVFEAAKQFRAVFEILGKDCASIDILCRYVQVNLGIALVKGGKPREGISALEEVVPALESLTLTPQVSAAWGALAFAYNRVKRYDEAKRAAERGLAIMGPGDGMARQRADLLLTLASAERAQGNKAKAKAIQRQASSLLRSQ